MVVRHPHRLALLALGMLALLTGLWAGLSRLGWDVPLPRSGFSSLHGPLMVSGFLGTLIGLERAVALGRPWAYAAPLLTRLGAVGLIVGAPLLAAQLSMLAGSLGLVVIFVAIIRRHPAMYTFTMGGGSLVWALGNLFWCLGWPVFLVVFWWAAFLVVTIAGERLELARLQQVTGAAQTTFLLLLGILLTLLTDFGRLFYEVKLRVEGVSTTLLLDAMNGERLSPITPDLAPTIAGQYVRSPATVVGVEIERYTTRKKKRAYDAVRVRFDNGDATERLVLDRQTGEILEDEGRWRKVHFAVMQLHQLNFFGFDKTLLNIPGVPILLMSLSGLLLWGFHRARAHRARNAAVVPTGLPAAPEETTRA